VIIVVETSKEKAKIEKKSQEFVKKGDYLEKSEKIAVDAPGKPVPKKEKK